MCVVAAVVVVVSTAAAVCVLQHRLDGKWKFVLEKEEGNVRERGSEGGRNEPR